MTPQPLDDTQAAERERSAFFDAVRASTQTMPGLFAWGVVTGAAMMQSGLPLWQSLLMTLVVYAGSAQLAALPLLAAGAPVWVIAFTALMVNFRFVIFSAVIGPAGHSNPRCGTLLADRRDRRLEPELQEGRLRAAPGFGSSTARKDSDIGRDARRQGTK